ELGMISGLIRTVRWQRDIDNVNLLTLTVSDPRPSSEDLVQSVVTLYDHQFVNNNANKINVEYILQDGVFLSNRLIDSTEVNNYLNSKFSNPSAQMKSLGKSHRPLKLSISAPGLLNTLEFVNDPVWSEPLGDYDIE